MDFLKKERQELLEFKVNDDKKTQELLVRVHNAVLWGGGDKDPGWDAWRGLGPTKPPHLLLTTALSVTKKANGCFSPSFTTRIGNTSATVLEGQGDGYWSITES